MNAISKHRNEHTFKPGISGNPNGAPKGRKRLSPKQYLDIKAFARKHGPDAVSILARIMRNKKAPVTARIQAAGMLLDRGYGRPAQKIDIQAIMGAIDLTRLSDSQLEQMEGLIGLAAGSVLGEPNGPPLIEGETNVSHAIPNEADEQLEDSDVNGLDDTGS